VGKNFYIFVLLGGNECASSIEIGNIFFSVIAAGRSPLELCDARTTFRVVAKKTIAVSWSPCDAGKKTELSIGDNL